MILSVCIYVAHGRRICVKNLNRLKICFLAGTLGQGGAERQLYYQLQALTTSGAQPVLICFSRGEYWQAPIEALGIEVIVVDVRSRLIRLAKTVTFLRSYRPEIVQSAHFYMNLYSLLGAMLCGARAIGAVRSSGRQDILDAGSILGYASLMAMRFLAVNSQNAARYIEGKYSKHPWLFYLPNIVDTDRFSPSNLRNGKRVRILMVARFVREKRFDLFLELLSKLHQAGRDNFEGHLVGDGPEKSGMEQLAANLGLGNGMVHFHGSVVDVERLYHQADVCVHLSDWEGTPNTVLEAMSCGLPVIASRVGGIPDVLEDGQTGFLVEKGDEAGLQRRLEQLIDNESLRKSLGSAARTFIQRNHSMDRLPGFLAELYKGVFND